MKLLDLNELTAMWRQTKPKQKGSLPYTLSSEQKLENGALGNRKTTDHM